jgi:predicted Zn-dependent peptidase
MRPPSRPFPFVAVVALAAALVSGLTVPAAAQGRFRRTPPLPDSFRELRLPEIQMIPMANGLTVAVTPQPGSPLVTLQVVIRAGESDSPRDLPYAATLAARMIGRGTKELSGDDMENMVESIGGDLSVTVSMDYTVLTFQVLAEFLDRALDTMRLMILEPEFRDLGFASIRRTFFYELQDRKKNPEFVGHRHLLRILFENNPYQTATWGEDVLRYVTMKDAHAFYNRFYAPNNAVFVVAGDVDGPAIARKIGQRFGTWPRRVIDRPAAPPAPTPNSKERVCFIDHPAAEEAVIFVGNLVMPPTAPDYYPFLVLNQALGGTMNSRLFMNLRESKGFASAAFSEAEFFQACGIFWAKARVAPETIHAAVQEIIKEFMAFSSQKIVPAEIEEAKSFLVGQLPLKFESPDRYADRLAWVVALGLDAGHWSRASDNLMLVNVEKVLEAAQKYLPMPPVIVIVGKMEWAAAALKDFNAVEIYDSTGAFKTILRQGVEK